MKSNHPIASQCLVDPRDLRDEFHLTCLILKHGITTNIASFSLAGLRSPFSFTFAEDGSAIEIGREEYDGALTAYMERFYERLADLTGNNRMICIVRLFNEGTRQIRRAAVLDRADFEADALCVLALTDALLKLEIDRAVNEVEMHFTRYMDRLPTQFRQVDQKSAPVSAHQ